MRFGRKKTQDDEDPAATDGGHPTEEGAADPRANGPWDASEVTIEEGDASRLDPSKAST